jgi:selenocysteine lyase/cysteine desulfurase
MSIASFRATLDRPDITSLLRGGLIGEGAPVPGPFGEHPMVYADYVASGRALLQVEDFVMREVLPWYANSHTEASHCGGVMTRMRAEARATIARLTRARGCAVIFAGSGATAGLNRLVRLLGVDTTPDAVVFIGPYEHHSNILPWRESGAKIVEIPEASGGGPDLAALEAALTEHADAPLKVGAFSAASNVTGIVTDPAPVTAILRAHGARSVWDYAGGGPYLPIDMRGIDAAVVSPHKFPGGPGASGVLIVRRDAVRTTTPTWPGGGTVAFVSPWGHDYAASIEAREEAGTPNVIGDIRAALAFLVKDAVGPEAIATRESDLIARATAAWSAHPRIEIMGAATPAHRLPIFSLRIRDGAGGHIHQQLFTRMLSDVHGVQARGGCACAGPYAHRLLGIDRDASETLRADLQAGIETEKPGWTRLNFSYLIDDATADFIIAAVSDLADRAPDLARHYSCDTATARFTPRAA